MHKCENSPKWRNGNGHGNGLPYVPSGEFKFPIPRPLLASSPGSFQGKGVYLLKCLNGRRFTKMSTGKHPSVVDLLVVKLRRGGDRLMLIAKGIKLNISYEMSCQKRILTQMIMTPHYYIL